MQAETLASAYRLWRRNWKGKGREYTAGALVWQVRLPLLFYTCDRESMTGELTAFGYVIMYRSTTAGQ